MLFLPHLSHPHFGDGSGSGVGGGGGGGACGDGCGCSLLSIVMSAGSGGDDDGSIHYLRIAMLDPIVITTAAAVRPPLVGAVRRFRGETRRYFGRKHNGAIYSGLARRIVIGRCNFLSVVNICYRVLSRAQKRRDNK